jgi:hypothetical protein
MLSAFNSEIHSILHRIQEKITRIRGSYALFCPAETPAAPPAPKGDPLVRNLLITTIVLFVVTVLAYVGYVLVLGQSVPAVQGSEQSSASHSNDTAPFPVSASRSEVSL